MKGLIPINRFFTNKFYDLTKEPVSQCNRIVNGGVYVLEKLLATVRIYRFEKQKTGIFAGFLL